MARLCHSSRKSRAALSVGTRRTWASPCNAYAFVTAQYIEIRPGQAESPTAHQPHSELRHPWRLSQAPDEPAGIDKIVQHYCAHAMRQYTPEGPRDKGPSQPRHFCQCGLNRTCLGACDTSRCMRYFRSWDAEGCLIAPARIASARHRVR